LMTRRKVEDKEGGWGQGWNLRKTKKVNNIKEVCGQGWRLRTRRKFEGTEESWGQGWRLMVLDLLWHRGILRRCDYKEEEGSERRRRTRKRGGVCDENMVDDDDMREPWINIPDVSENFVLVYSVKMLFQHFLFKGNNRNLAVPLKHRVGNINKLLQTDKYQI
jgi:hypothetical protein